MWKIENFQRTTTSTTKHQIRIYTHIYIISFISITGIKKMEILLIKSKKINFCITCSKRGAYLKRKKWHIANVVDNRRCSRSNPDTSAAHRILHGTETNVHNIVSHNKFDDVYIAYNCNNS